MAGAQWGGGGWHTVGRRELAHSGDVASLDRVGGGCFSVKKGPNHKDFY